MYCNNCGKHNPEDSKFCQSCGSKMVKASAEHETEKAKEHETVETTKVQEANKSSKTKKKGSYTHWFLWWILDKDELTKQIQGYKSLGIWHSARKISALLLLFSSAITIGAIAFFNWDSSSLYDVGAMLFIAFFVYRGNRWAMILAMLYWTFAKFYGLYISYSTTSTTHTSPIIAVLWWAIYMHAFYEAFKVEQLRRKEEYEL